MAQTATQSTSLNTNASLASFFSKGGKIEFGTINMGSDLPTAGGSLSFSMANCKWAQISTYDGFVFEYDIGSSKIFAYKQSSNVLGALTSASSGNLSSLSDVPYMAWGYQ